MAFINKVSEKLGESRTVDEQRGASLKAGSKHLKSYPRIPSGSFTLEWKGEEIEFVTLDKHEHFEPNSEGLLSILNFHVTKCQYPKGLFPFRAEIRQMIAEALDIYGYGYGRGDRTKVLVTFDPAIGLLNPDFELPDGHEWKERETPNLH